jgi:ketosteroid isomerase-like protein
LEIIMASTKEIAERFVAATGGKSDPELAEIFAPQVAVSHVYDDWDSPMEMDGPTMAASTGADHGHFQQLMPDYELRDLRLFVGDDGFAMTRTVSGTLASGTTVKYAYCAVVTVVDGKITRIMAYQDREMAAELGKAVQEAMSQTA